MKDNLEKCLVYTFSMYVILSGKQYQFSLATLDTTPHYKQVSVVNYKICFHLKEKVRVLKSDT